jgi:tRNA(Ile)-lysidine synthase
MLQRFKQFIKQENLFLKNQKILVAVSSGIDSVALCYLMHEAGYSFGLAHCNFKLRGKESDDDEKFVKQLSLKFHVPFHYKNFETKKYSEEKKISVQMAARDLRYEWFEEIRKRNHYDVIAVAHHQDDEVETFFINLIRGTGIAGLHGIKAKTGKIVRPLLFTGRKEIEEYVKKNKVKFREDKSNKSTKYLRNKVRLQLIPMLKELNPDIESTVKSEIRRIKQIESVFQKLVKEEQEEIQSTEGNVTKFNISKLLLLENKELFLYEFLKPYGFSGDIIQQILKSLNAESGRQFMSDSYRLIKDRKFLIISPHQADEVLESYIVTRGYKELVTPIHVEFSEKKFSKKIEINKAKNVACLDLDKLQFPLHIRKWERGDYFIPFGMKGKKKLSDYFTDMKFSLIEKENTWLLCNGDDIIWVVGHRIDERYKVTGRTKNIFIAEKV